MPAQNNYVTPTLETYGASLGEANFGAAGGTINVIGPKGKVGMVRDISVDVTTSIVGTTTVPEINVGISSGDSTYGRFRLGSTASLGYSTGIRRASAQSVITGNPPRNAQDYAHHIELDGYPLGTSGSLTGGSSTTVNPAGRIPKDTAFVISAVIAVGAAAGKGYVQVQIEWF